MNAIKQEVEKLLSVPALPYKPDRWKGRGYPVYENDQLIGYHPGCSLCDQFGWVPNHSYSRGSLETTVLCPNCKGSGWAPWYFTYVWKHTYIN